MLLLWGIIAAVSGFFLVRRPLRVNLLTWLLVAQTTNSCEVLTDKMILLLLVFELVGNETTKLTGRINCLDFYGRIR